ncbi:MAG TPA: HIT domain-containing protein [Victivallales bacterium]|nr:HIT domain-containing protein [Victivallales bacterium]
MDKLISCPFCEQDFKSNVFNETEYFLAAYNIAPILPGHSIIIPKKHVSSLLELSQKEKQEAMLYTCFVIERLIKIFNSTGFDFSIQDGNAAGQTVNHFHIHLIPRKENDLESPGEWYPLLRESNLKVLDSDLREKINKSDMIKIVSFIKSKFGNDSFHSL